MRRGPAVFLLVCLLVGAAYGAWRAAGEGYARLTRFQPAYAAAEWPATGSTPLADRLVLLVIDGLRTEEAHRLPSLDWLRRRGAGYRLTHHGPSSPAPLLASLLTGSPATQHGVLADGINVPLATDDLLQAAARSQVSAGGAGGSTLGGLTAGRLTPWFEGESLAQLGEDVSALLGPGGPRLVVIQAGDLTPGRTNETLAELDTRLVSLFDQIDWQSTALMVLGTAEPGAEGRATVPLLLAGSGVLAGAGGDAALYDVAPTAAALLGLPTPVAAQGRPIVSALQLEGRPLDALMQIYLTSRRAYAAGAVAAYGSLDTVPEAPSAASEAEDYLARLEQQVKAAWKAWITEGLKERLPYLGGGALILLLYLLVLYRGPFGGPAFGVHLTYGILFTALYLALGGRLGQGVADLGLPWQEPAYRYGLASAAAMLLAAVVGGMLVSRKEYRRTRYLAASGLHAALGLVALIALPVGVAVLVTGWEFPVALPDAHLWVGFFLVALQVVVIGCLGPVWAWATVRVARFARRQWPVKEVGDPEVNADKVVRLRALRRAGRQRR